MAAPVKPALKKALGNESWGWAPSIGDITLPALTELSAAEGFNLSCSVFAGQDGPTATTEKVTLPQLLCETETYEVNGATSHSMPDFQISFDPQGAALSDGKQAWEAMDDLASGFLWRRQGKGSSSDLAVGDFVDIWPSQLGVKVPGKSSTDSSSVFVFTVAASVTGAPEFNVAVVAGT